VGARTGSIDRRFDALVVGSGAAGSIAVKELTERGLDVLLLEAGRDLTEADFTPPPPKPPRPLGMDLHLRAKAALAGQHVQARRTFFSETSNRFLVNDRENPYSTPRDAPYLWIRGRILGGRLNSYGRVLQRMSDVDFKAASTDGHGEDWPISYPDVEPYYDRVEEFIGVHGNEDGIAHPPDGKYVGPAKLSAVEQEFKEKVEERWPERRVISWRYAAPNLGRVPRGIAAARETGRLTTRVDAVVSRITVDDRTGLADGAVFVDRLTKREHRVFADVVLLCASTIESLRLMLNSSSVKHPNGLGNSTGLLGRYFMDQTVSMAFCAVPDYPGYWLRDDSAPPDPFYAPAGGVLIPRWVNMGPADDQVFARGFSFQGAGGRFPVPEGVPTSFGIGAAGEILPSYDNRVTLNTKRTDAWGVPIAHIRCALSENDEMVVREGIEALREMVEHCGYHVNFVGSVLGLDSKKVFPDASLLSRFVFRRGIGRSLAMGAAIHECGGARMGSDPRTSVLNGVNQSWEVPNLFVTDGSCFVSSSTVGPALTIMALTARACEFIAREHASGGLSRATAAPS
jgi:choline dehydrogenase-like flavoprotein